MSLITRCPTCSTLFRVVPDQLKVSAAWVRCGRCDEIFDASQYFLPPVRGVQARDISEGLQGHQPPAPKTPAVSNSLAPVLQGPAVPDELVEEQSTSDRVPLAAKEANSLPVSFVRHAQRQAFWRQPLLRWTLALGSLGLLCLLVLQILLQYPDTVVGQVPQLSPAVHALCKRLPCALSVQRRIEWLVIDSSSFNAVSTNRYRLSVGLKNKGSAAVEIAALELTLTDPQGQTLLRRVLLPPEFAGQTRVLAAQAETLLTVELELEQALLSPSVSAATDASQAPGVAGYRVLLFYP